MSGENYSPGSEFQTRTGYTWIDATHLVGHGPGAGDMDQWLWEPGTAPKPADLDTYAGSPYLGPYGAKDLWVPIQGGGPWSCRSPLVQDGTGAFEVPVLCDVLGVIGSEILLGHWNSDRLPGDWNDPNDGNGTVVALDIHGADSPFEDPALRRVVATAEAPERVTFATDLIGAALDADGGAS